MKIIKPSLGWTLARVAYRRALLKYILYAPGFPSRPGKYPLFFLRPLEETRSYMNGNNVGFTGR